MPTASGTQLADTPVRNRRVMPLTPEAVPGARGGSSAGKNQVPATLNGRISWLLAKMAEETPAKMHRMDIEPDSALGSPVLTDQFRRYINGNPADLTSPTSYSRPLAAALRRMAEKDKPLLARWCLEVGRASGDWQAVADRRKYASEEAHAIVLYALGCLWWEFYDPIMRR